MNGWSSPRKKWVLTQEAFDKLLSWLDPERNRAGERYEELRSRLIKIFVCRGCPDAEELADETMNRVAKKIVEIEASYVGQRELYFYGVARMIHQEYVRRKPAPLWPPHPNSFEYSEQEYTCLERCVQALTPEDRELILKYYEEEKETKIDRRKELAQRLHFSSNALRIRACRIRERLGECIGKCLEQPGTR